MPRKKYDPSIVMEKIKQLRKEKGVTQKELAEGAGIGLSTVKQYETGKRVPDQFNLKRMADYFGVLEEWIMGETPYKNDLERIYATVSDEQYAEIHKELAFWDWLEDNFEFDFLQYSPEQLGKLESDIKDYTKFKIDQLKKEG